MCACIEQVVYQKWDYAFERNPDVVASVFNGRLISAMMQVHRDSMDGLQMIQIVSDKTAICIATTDINAKALKLVPMSWAVNVAPDERSIPSGAIDMGCLPAPFDKRHAYVTGRTVLPNEEKAEFVCPFFIVHATHVADQNQASMELVHIKDDEGTTIPVYQNPAKIHAGDVLSRYKPQEAAWQAMSARVRVPPVSKGNAKGGKPSTVAGRAKAATAKASVQRSV